MGEPGGVEFEKKERSLQELCGDLVVIEPEPDPRELSHKIEDRDAAAADRAAKAAKDAPKVLNGAVMIKREQLRQIERANARRSAIASISQEPGEVEKGIKEPSFDELLVLGSLGREVHAGVDGHALSQSEMVERLDQGAQAKVGLLLQPTSEGPFTQQKVDTLLSFRKELKVVAPPTLSTPAAAPAQ
jgi:hypothetical protein